MSLQNPAGTSRKVMKVRAIHHYAGVDKWGNPFSTVEVELQLNGAQTKLTTMRYPEVKEMERGKAELAKFGSLIQDPLL